MQTQVIFYLDILGFKYHWLLVCFRVEISWQINPETSLNCHADDNFCCLLTIFFIKHDLATLKSHDSMSDSDAVLFDWLLQFVKENRVTGSMFDWVTKSDTVSIYWKKRILIKFAFWWLLYRYVTNSIYFHFCHNYVQIHIKTILTP